jgi:hypothetical protein
MLTRKSFTLFIVLLLALFGVACTTTEEGSAVIEPPLAEAAVVDPVLDPAELTSAFYEWYMAYTQTGNPLIDKAYHDSPYLSPALVAEVDALLASFEGGGYDPFLCAQDRPGTWRTGAVDYHNGHASVPFIQVWNPDSDFEMERELTVHLVGDDSGWLIREIVCPLPPEPEAKTPEQVVAAFYDWYLIYTEHVGNPLVDKAYHDSPDLSPDLVAEVDALLASFEGGGYDPFLCAQDRPGTWRTGAVDYHNGQASVPFIQVWNPDSDFEMERELTVYLVGDDSGWLIREIVCPLPPEPEAKTPEQVVAAFYDWYLIYTEHVGNPLVDKAYHDSPDLSPDLVAEVDALLASFEGGGYDPFLCAQDRPGTWRTGAVDYHNGQASVPFIQVWNPDSDFEMERELTVYLVGDDSGWLIREIVCPLPPEPEA